VIERAPALAFLSWGDRFEDFHDKLGITLDDLRDRLTGTWLFNYVEALQAAGLAPVLYFVSARVDETIRFAHGPTGAEVRVLPTPRTHRKLQAARDRFRWRSPVFASLRSYVATPWRSLAREMRADRCGAILCQEYEYPRFDGAVALGRVVGVPVFATYQGGAAPGSAIERPIRGVAVRRAAGLIAGSRPELDRVRATYRVPGERLAMIPNALDVRRWRPTDRLAARAELGIAADAEVAVWHGRVEVDSKGLDVLLRAWRLVAGATSDRRLLLIVGTGQDADAFKREVAQTPGDTVRWDKRWVYEPAEVGRYLSAADVAIRPSRREGFAVSLVEAMACGLPIVATDVSGVREALGKDATGIVVSPEDPEGIARAVDRLFRDDALRAELGRRARSRAEAEFSLGAVGSLLGGFWAAGGAAGPRAPDAG
jgi:glycosyltransferase involved in cell wall biosynthesis